MWSGAEDNECECGRPETKLERFGPLELVAKVMGKLGADVKSFGPLEVVSKRESKLVCLQRLTSKTPVHTCQRAPLLVSVQNKNSRNQCYLKQESFARNLEKEEEMESDCLRIEESPLALDLVKDSVRQRKDCCCCCCFSIALF